MGWPMKIKAPIATAFGAGQKTAVSIQLPKINFDADIPDGYTVIRVETKRVWISGTEPNIIHVESIVPVNPDWETWYDGKHSVPDDGFEDCGIYAYMTEVLCQSDDPPKQKNQRREHKGSSSPFSNQVSVDCGITFESLNKHGK